MAGAECVSAPTETKSAPVAASSGIRSSVTPPEISIFARPRARRRRRECDRSACCRRGSSRRRPRAPRRPARASPPRFRPAAPAGGARTRDGGLDAAGQTDVVVLDQDRVEEADAMVRRAAGADGVLLQHAQRRRRLAGVEDRDAAAGRVDEPARPRRDAGEPLQKIERGALADQQRARGADDLGDLVTGAAGVAVVLARERQRHAQARPVGTPRTRRPARRARSRLSSGRRRAPSAPARTVASVVMSPSRTSSSSARRTMSR